jgi:hypothetical protein
VKYVTGILAAVGAFFVVLFKLERRKAQQAELRAVRAEAKAQDEADQAEVKSATDKATSSEDKARRELAALNDPSLPKL